MATMTVGNTGAFASGNCGSANASQAHVTMGKQLLSIVNAPSGTVFQDKKGAALDYNKTVEGAKARLAQLPMLERYNRAIVRLEACGCSRHLEALAQLRIERMTFDPATPKPQVNGKVKGKRNR